MTRLQRAFILVNQPHAFKHRDILRLVKAARAAGVDVEQVTVDPHNGAVSVGPAQSASGKRPLFDKPDAAASPKLRAKP
jgi:hypothetical protein